MPLIGGLLGLNLLLQVHFRGVHGLGQLLGLPGQFVELGDGVLGRIGGSRGTPPTRNQGNRCDSSGQRLEQHEFSVKFQNQASL